MTIRPWSWQVCRLTRRWSLLGDECRKLYQTDWERFWMPHRSPPWLHPYRRTTLFHLSSLARHLMHWHQAKLSNVILITLMLSSGASFLTIQELKIEQRSTQTCLSRNRLPSGHSSLTINRLMSILHSSRFASYSTSFIHCGICKQRRYWTKWYKSCSVTFRERGRGAGTKRDERQQILGQCSLDYLVRQWS